MKIKKIIIENFKGISYKKVEFEDGKMSGLLGSNGVGKSSFIEALRYGLTGVAPQNPVRDGAESASVEILMEDGTSFSRTVYAGDKPSKVKVNGKTTPAKNLNTWISENFGFSTDILKIATSSEVLSSMKSDELGDFLLKYIPEKLSVTKVLGFIPEPTEDVQEAVLLALPDEDFEVTDIIAVHEVFMDIRKGVKKEVDYLNSMIAKLPEIEPTRKLPEIQREYDALCEKEGMVKGSIDAVKLYESVIEKRKCALDNLANMQKKFDSIVASRPNPSVRKDLEEKLAEARSQISESESMIGIMQSSVNAFKDTLERLSTNHCPLSDSIVCSTDKTQAKNEILEVIKSNEDGIAIQSKKIEEKEAEISALSLSLKKYDSNALAYKEKILIGEQIEKAKKTIPDLPEKPAAISSLTEADFEKEKAILKAEMEYAKKWEERFPLLKKVEEEKRVFETYDYLCKAFAPKGEVMTRILSFYLSIFEEEIGAKANMLRDGMKVKFVPENGLKYFIKMKEEKEFHLYDELSKGEKTLAAFLLLDLVSSLCGTKIMILDDLNNLDAGAIAELFDVLVNPDFQKDYDHIIFSSVNSSDVMEIVGRHDAVIQKV